MDYRRYRDTELTSVNGRKRNDTIEMEALLRNAAITKYSRWWRRRPVLRKTWATDQDQAKFVNELFSNATVSNRSHPEVLSKNMVDVNEKEYSNQSALEGSGDDETCVKLVNTVGTTKSHNYQIRTTKGVQWGVSANLGLQFGIPHAVGATATGGVGGSYNRSRSVTETTEKQKTDNFESQTHHEEKVKIPQGKKVMVRVTTYKVKYKLEYTLEYKISKTASVYISYSSLGKSVPACVTSRGFLTASEILRTLPGFREDDEFAYFGQDEEIRWTADKAVVEKTLEKLNTQP